VPSHFSCTSSHAFPYSASFAGYMCTTAKCFEPGFPCTVAAIRSRAGSCACTAARFFWFCFCLVSSGWHFTLPNGSGQFSIVANFVGPPRCHSAPPLRFLHARPLVTTSVDGSYGGHPSLSSPHYFLWIPDQIFSSFPDFGAASFFLRGATSIPSAVVVPSGYCFFSALSFKISTYVIHFRRTF